MLRIVHVINSLDPSRGGPPMVATRLAAAQAGLGHDVSLLRVSEPEASGRVRAALGGLPFGERLGVLDVSVPRLPMKLVGRSGVGELREVLRGVDAVHLHGMWDPVLHAAAAACRGLGVPYGVCPHGMLTEWSLSQRRWKKRIGMLVMARRTLSGASFVHVLTEYERGCVESVGVKALTVRIPNGVFAEEFSELPADSSFRLTRPELGSDRYVLFLSRLHEVKGLEFLLEGFERLASRVGDVRLVVAGPDSGDGERFASLVSSSQYRDRVHVVGPLYGTAKLEALSGASAFCLPSRHEGFSVAIVEAMACGVPVVITEECCFPEVGVEGAGVVTKLNGASVGDGLIRVFEPGEGVRMGERGRALVFREYTWPRLGELSVSTYERSLGVGVVGSGDMRRMTSG